MVGDGIGRPRIVLGGGNLNDTQNDCALTEERAQDSRWRAINRVTWRRH